MDTKFLVDTPLFRGLPAAELDAMLRCLRARERHYRKDAVILRAGDTTRELGLVLGGSVRIENNDLWGNTSVLDLIGPGLAFAETYACLPREPMMVSAVAAAPTDILFLSVERILEPGEDACTHHAALIRNLLAITAQKNLTLSRRIFHTSSKRIRDRLVSYLSFEAARHGSSEFRIPFNRSQLADYLSVERSALSNELGKMRREGLLETDRSYFSLKRLPSD